jgi:molecular chaperone IbpA
MVMDRFDFSPLFRSTIGFDRLTRLVDAATRVDSAAVAYPPYNIETTGEDAYRLTMAVAGFSPAELDITVQENTLLVTGKAQTEDENGGGYLHRGIARRTFERRFSLADHMKVTGASLNNGLLSVDVVREVPEAAKPHTIKIDTTFETVHIERNRSNVETPPDLGRFRFQVTGKKAAEGGLIREYPHLVLSCPDEKSRERGTEAGVIQHGWLRLPASRPCPTASPRSLDCRCVLQFSGTTLLASVTPLSQESPRTPAPRRHYFASTGPLKSAVRGSATRLPSPSRAHASTSKPAASSRVTWEGMPSRYFVIEVPHHPGSWRRNLSESKTYHVINLERRPSSPNSDTTQSPYCSICLSILFLFGALDRTRIILIAGWGGRLVDFGRLMRLRARQLAPKCQ